MDKRRRTTTSTVFIGSENQKHLRFTRNPDQENRARYKQYFAKLKLFLQFYKEKLMLTRKLQDSLGEHVVTVE